MRTFGEFYDAVYGWCTAKSYFEGHTHMKDWTEIPNPEVTWEEARAMEFSGGLFNAFAQDMATYLMERVQRICTDALWQRTMTEGHEFLKAITQTGRDFGLNVMDYEVDVPLSFFDSLARGELAKRN
jgi:hypothetical protein